MADKASFTLDTHEFLKRMNLYDERSSTAAKVGMQQNVLDLERQGKEHAPIDEGTLRREIIAAPVKVMKGGIEGEVHAGTGQSKDYAVYQHETTNLQPGEGTAAAPGGAAGPAGPKYLQRPLLHFSRKYMQNIANHIKAVK